MEFGIPEAMWHLRVNGFPGDSTRWTLTAIAFMPASSRRAVTRSRPSNCLECSGDRKAFVKLTQLAR